MNISDDKHFFSSGILHLVGYGLLLMALVDFAFLIIPPQFMNPAWELQTIGSIIERIPIILLGLVLVYYGESEARAPIERFLLRWLSKFSLFMAILMLLIIPLTISNSFRVYYQHNSSVNTQVHDQLDAIENLRLKLKNANSSLEIKNALQQQSRQNITLPDSVNASKLKKNILKELQNNQDNIRDRAKSISSSKKVSLFKNCFKWNLGALISAVILFYIWQYTFWTRIKYEPDID